MYNKALTTCHVVCGVECNKVRPTSPNNSRNNNQSWPNFRKGMKINEMMCRIIEIEITKILNELFRQTDPSSISHKNFDKIKNDEKNKEKDFSHNNS